MRERSRGFDGLLHNLGGFAGVEEKGEMRGSGKRINTHVSTWTKNMPDFIRDQEVVDVAVFPIRSSVCAANLVGHRDYRHAQGLQHLWPLRGRRWRIKIPPYDARSTPCYVSKLDQGSNN